MLCEACERGECHLCGMQTWCQCECDGNAVDAVELDRREQGCEHCGSLDVNPKCPACQGIER